MPRRDREQETPAAASRLEVEPSSLQADVVEARQRAARAERELDEERKQRRDLARRLLRAENLAATERQARAMSESRLADAEDVVAQREERLRFMEGTRAWRLASRYWRTRDRVRRLFGFRTTR